MKLNQLSLFLENKPAHLKVPCRALADAGINVLTLSLADTQQFGILRLLVKDWEQGKKVLEEAGCVVNITEVVAVEVPDRPGGLAELLALMEAGGINIEYMYAFTARRGESAVMIFRFENADAAIAALQARGVNPVQGVDLYE
jgi:hypothetical protein